MVPTSAMPRVSSQACTVGSACGFPACHHGKPPHPIIVDIIIIIVIFIVIIICIIIGLVSSFQQVLEGHFVLEQLLHVQVPRRELFHLLQHGLLLLDGLVTIMPTPLLLRQPGCVRIDRRERLVPRA